MGQQRLWRPLDWNVASTSHKLTTLVRRASRQMSPAVADISTPTAAGV
jgi:hypothetical protein